MNPYSDPYPTLTEKRNAIARAEEAYFQELTKLFPLGMHVQINHWRGRYYGHVVGHSARERRLIIKSENTGKQSVAYPEMMIDGGVHVHRAQPAVRLLDRSEP